MKLLGLSCRLECCILCIIIGAFIGANLFCSCITKEGFNAAGSAINYAMGDGVPGEKFGEKQVYNPASSYEKVQTPLPEGQLFFYANNHFKPECCKFSTVSGSGGCACETTEQVNYLRNRGGNKTK